MMKHMKKAISFVMAVCLLAGNSYVDTGAPIVTMEPVMIQESTSPGAGEAQETVTSVETDNMYEDNVRKASAEDTTTGTGGTGTGGTGTNENVNTGGYAFYANNATGELIHSGQVAELDTKSMKLTVTKLDAAGNPGPIPAGVTVKLESGNEEVISVKADADTSFGGVIERQGPGYAQVIAYIEEPGVGTYIITCLVKVDLTVIDTDPEWRNYTETDRVLVLEQAKPYQVRLKYVNDDEIGAAQVTWDWTNEGVITIENGVITPVGAGTSKVTITTDTDNENNKADETTFEVIVRPSGSVNAGDSYDKYESQIDWRTSANKFSLYSNGNPAANMDWKFYSVVYDKTKEELVELKESNDLFNCKINDVNGILEFTNVKAGTYKIVGYASEKYGEFEWNKVVYDIIVDLSIEDSTIYMNVDDIFDIMENSNIPNGVFKDLFSITYEDTSNGPHIVNISEEGLVEAVGKGETKVKILYKGEKVKGKSIFDPADTSNYTRQAIYTFRVIDGLSLNSTILNLYTGATYQLLASVTDRTVPVVWESSDPSRVTVDQNGLVTAVKPTEQNKPVRVKASQFIDGVEKSIVCNVYVQPAITEITIDPEEILLDKDEYATLKASVKPSNISGTTLRWMSSDENIFKIVESSALTVTIQGAGGGTAVLTAINAENIVVGYCKVTVKQAATGIKVEPKGPHNVKLSDKTFQLYAEVSPAEATNKNVIWTSLDTGIATVNDKGLVTFKKAGTVTIRVAAEDNPGVAEEFVIFNISGSVTGVKFDSKELEMYVGETERLTYTLSPKDLQTAGVTFTSFDTSIVSVDNSGKVTAKGAGTTQIMIMTTEGSYYDICKIVVKEDATSVKMNYTEVFMNRGEYFDMEVTIAPATSTEISLTWESLNPDIATVSSTGRITARAVGTAIVLVRTRNGVTSYCTVTVLEPVTSLELDPTDIIIEVGEVFAIDPVFKPAKPSNMEVKWESFNTSVATVNAIGEVEGKTRGTTVITCESVDGGFKSFCMVTVVDPELRITVTPDNYRLGYGKTYTLKATVTSHGKPVEGMDLVWSSDDDSICTVDEYGTIYGQDFGDAVITVAIDNDDYDVSATCDVRVVREVTSIKLNHSVLTIIKGHTASIHADVKPSNATYTDVTFSSENEKIATIDEDGMITAVEIGNVWIWAKAKDNSGKYARCYVTVMDPVPATGINVSDKKVVLIPGEKKLMNYTIKPTNSTDDVIWTSGEESIATVDGTGMITAHRTGTTTVTAMTTSGKTAEIEVIVLGLSRTSLEMPVYTQYSRLTVDGATGTVRWDVENTTICEVNNGVITARKVGTTYVSATVNGRTLRCKVTVTANKKKK